MALTPGIESPTVSPLHREGWVAVRSMVRRDARPAGHGRAVGARAPAASSPPTSTPAGSEMTSGAPTHLPAAGGPGRGLPVRRAAGADRRGHLVHLPAVGPRPVHAVPARHAPGAGRRLPRGRLGHGPQPGRGPRGAGCGSSTATRCTSWTGTRCSAVTLRPGSPWAVLDLSDGTSVSAVGIQGSDGARARRQVAELTAPRRGEVPPPTATTDPPDRRPADPARLQPRNLPTRRVRSLRNLPTRRIWPRADAPTRLVGPVGRSSGYCGRAGRAASAGVGVPDAPPQRSGRWSGPGRRGPR